MNSFGSLATVPVGPPAGVATWVIALAVLTLSAATLEGVVRTLVQQRYDWRAYLASLGDALLSRSVDLLGLSMAVPILSWAYAHRLHTVELSGPLSFLALFLGQEFLYYWYHRAAHRVGWFWATHAVHHSPNELTLASALRLGWTGKLTGTVLFFAPLAWLGFAPSAVVAMVALNLHYQFWLHAPWMPRLGPLEWVLNTPSHHKVHHGSNSEYLDCNYGGVLIVFDRCFGTYAAERLDVPIRYGLTTPLLSHNPLRISLHGWCDLASRLRQAGDWRNFCRVLLGPPQASPPPISEKTPNAVLCSRAPQ